ncbi:hypothetical protein FF011L_05570 [Roseimaritima multifibrata]|uniref:Uncharacterized protein n=1 Tax=Roseimaritima multifibrata TaxID=1930274 RepID=A0A517MA98_9BACT|nr:hypothetical protein FF011L_05570 [Roseimaritima multifibrata]
MSNGNQVIRILAGEGIRNRTAPVAKRYGSVLSELLMAQDDVSQRRVVSCKSPEKTGEQCHDKRSDQ